MCYQLFHVRLSKDLWNNELALFHIKEYFIMLILVRLSIILDNKSTNITRSDAKWTEGFEILAESLKKNVLYFNDLYDTTKLWTDPFNFIAKLVLHYGPNVIECFAGIVVFKAISKHVEIWGLF